MEAFSQEQLEEHFKPLLIYTRPELLPHKKSANKPLTLDKPAKKLTLKEKIAAMLAESVEKEDNE